MDAAVLSYGTGIGRGSLEFQAGDIVSAYAASHGGVTVYHEDERLVVFHIAGPRPARDAKLVAQVRSKKQ
jgi:hypothetical protein